MASPVIEGTAESSTNTAGTSHTVTLPASIAASDMVLIIMDIGSTSATLNALTDWEEILDEAVANGLKILRYTGAGVPSDPTFTSSANTRSARIAFRISGADKTITPQIGTTATGTSATPDPPSVTPTGGVSKDYLFIAFAGMAGEEADDDTWGNTPPTNYTPSPPLQKSCGTAGTNLGGLILAASRQLTTGAAENPGTFGVDTSAAWRAQTIIVHPGGTDATAEPAVCALVMSAPAPTLQAGATASPDPAALVGTMPAVTAGVFADALPAPARLWNHIQQGSYLNLPGALTTSWTQVPNETALQYAASDLEFEWWGTVEDGFTHGSIVHLLAGKIDTLSINTGGFYWSITTTGAVRFLWANGSTNFSFASTTLLQDVVSVKRRFGLKTTWVRNNGSSVWEVQHYYNIGAGWVSLGGQAGAVLGVIAAVNWVFRMGCDIYGNNGPHNIHQEKFIARDGIDGNVLLSIDWTKQAGGTGSFVADTGQTVSKGASPTIVGLVSAGSSPTPAAAALAATMPVPILSAGASSSPTATPLVLDPKAVVAGVGATVTPDATPLVLTPQAVTLSAGGTTTPAAVALVLAPQAPTPSAGSTTSPAVVAVILTPLAPTPSAGSRVDPAVAALALSSPQVQVLAGSTSAPATTALVLTPQTVTASGGEASTASPDVVALVLDPKTVSLLVSATASPDAAPLVLDPKAVSASGGSAGTASPNVVALLLDPKTTAQSAGSLVDAAVAALALTPQEVGASAGAAPTPDTVPMASTYPPVSPSAGAASSPAAVVLLLDPKAVSASGTTGAIAFPNAVSLVLIPQQVTATGDYFPDMLYVAEQATPSFTGGLVDHRTADQVILDLNGA